MLDLVVIGTLAVGALTLAAIAIVREVRSRHRMTRNAMRAMDR